MMMPKKVHSEARRWRVGGRVQGVGYRPFVYRLAHSCQLTGWVRNSCGAVEIHGEGSTHQLNSFAEELFSRPPPSAYAQLIDVKIVPLESNPAFSILSSAPGDLQQIEIPADLSMCEDCLAELRDPAARRYRYPFINCTQCGPRYTIIRALPYDRRNTTLEHFVLCAACQSEYSDPLDRRFHAQPLACEKCGPALYWSASSRRTLHGGSALSAAIESLREGRIIAIRGIGGYHLLCDAANEAAVLRLRERKGRPAKPFAVMVPWSGEDGLGVANRVGCFSPVQRAAIRAPARPIVLTPMHPQAKLAQAIAPGLREIGLMLPYSPVHFLLLEEFGAALVATSGNLSGEPVMTSPEESQRRLSHIADGFLHHNRRIVRPADDAVARVIAGIARPLRMGRGNAPLEMALVEQIQVPTLAVGAYLKGSIALAWDKRIIVSPHIGNQSTQRGRAVFAQVVEDLQSLYGVKAQRVIHDAHPGFPSTRWARESGLCAIPVWHHHAHASAVAGEFPGGAPILCFTWDGMGLGPDGSSWGGEALLGRPGEWRRVASFRRFRLPGGERCARDPWRSALSLCWHSNQLWEEGERCGGRMLREAFEAGVNAPWTTSAGRLFDAAAALTGVCMTMSYEGEAPMRLEALCDQEVLPIALPLVLDSAGIWRCDWAPLVVGMLESGHSTAFRAAQFHASLAHVVLQQSLAVRAQTGVRRVGLAGGVFQNKVLTEQAQSLLKGAGFEVLIPERLPLNDAAISFGQIIESIERHDARV